MTILKCMSRKNVKKVWTKIIWLRTGTGGRPSKTQYLINFRLPIKAERSFVN